MPPSLKTAQSAVATARKAIDDLTMREQTQAQIVACAQAALAALNSQRETLNGNLAGAISVLNAAEERAIDDLNVRRATEILTRHRADPIFHQQWIADQVKQLRLAIRGEWHTPISSRVSAHSAILAALALIPPPNPLDVPVYMLGAAVEGQTDWPSRRKKILAESAAA